MKQAGGRSEVSREEKKSVNGNAENQNLFQHDWISDTAAPVCVLIVLEVLVAVVQSI